MASLKDVSVEVLTEIVKLAGEESDMRSIFSLCHVDQAMRRAALSIPDLWKDLAIICSVFPSIDGPLIPKSKSDLISFWYDRVEASVAFTLHFRIRHIAVGDLIRASRGVELVCLDGPHLWKIIRLLTRARRLITESTTLAYLRSRVEECQKSSCDTLGVAPALEIVKSPLSDAPQKITLQLLESLAVDCVSGKQDGPGGYEDEMRSFLALFGMPALRKCILDGNLVLHHATPNDNLPQSVQVAFEGMWGQLTRVQATFYATLTDWRKFFGGLRSLEMARIKVTIVESDDMEREAATIVIPNLKNLWLTIYSDIDGYSFGSVLDGFHLPALIILLLRAPRLTLECLHLLLQATPVLERIRIDAIFPTMDVQTYFVDFPDPSERLITHVPHLQHLMIDIPGINQFERSFREYVDGIAQSGWLEGRWGSGTLRVVLFWRRDDPSMLRMVEDLKEYLGLPEVADIGGRGEVKIALMDYADGFSEGEDMWFNISTEF